MKKSFVSIFLALAATVIFASGLCAAQRGIRVKSTSGKSLYLYRDYSALVVGVGDYTNGWPDLPGAIKDAKEVAAGLKAQGFDVKLVLNPNSTKLKRSLNDMAFRLGKEKNRALLLYFAGHGETLDLADGTQLGYIIPTDCPLKARDPMGFDDKAVSMREIEALALKVKSVHLLAMFDSCFSGSLFSLTRAAPVDITEKSAKPVRQFITAGEAGEQVPDRSVFKTVFLDGIKGEADLNRDGFVTGSELGMHLQDRVVNYSRGGQHPQYGKINNPKLDKGDFVFALKIKVRVPARVTPPPDAGLDDHIRKREDELRRLDDLLKKQEEVLKRQRELDERMRRQRAEEERRKREEEERKRQAALNKPKYYTPALPAPYGHIKSFNANVTAIRFYESGYNPIPYKERVYKKIFNGKTARYIFWELKLKFPSPGRKVDFLIEAIFRRADGSTYARQSYNAYVQSDWTWSWHTKGWGSRGGGTWKPGTYSVDLYVEGNRVASDSFEVM